MNTRRAVLTGLSTCGALGSAGFASANTAPSFIPIPAPEIWGVQIYKLQGTDYRVEEYLFSGSADVLESVNLSDAEDQAARDNIKDLGRQDARRVVRQRAVPYTTRLVVYRPRSIARFSGNVIVEPMHFSGGGTPVVWRMLNDVFMRNGDVHVSVQNPVTFAGLRRAAPTRYGSIAAAHPTQMWGMLNDVGALFKQSEAGPVHDLAVRRLYMTGYSYSGVATATFAHYHHDEARMPDGRPIYDGYLPMGNATYVRDLDVPVMRMNTQSDFSQFGGVTNRKPDCDAASGRFRLYEVGGASHSRHEPQWPGLLAPPPPTEDLLAPSGQPKNTPSGCAATFPEGSRANDFPFHHYSATMFLNLYAWVDHGARPPQGAFIALDDQRAPLLDELGNVRGGLRSLELVCPTARYGVGVGSCWTAGYAIDLPPAVLKRLYPNEGDYERSVALTYKGLVESRTLDARFAHNFKRVS